MVETLLNFARSTGINDFVEDPVLLYKTLAMYLIIGVLIYLAIGKKFEPLLLLPIAFGMLLANLPGAELFHMEYFTDPSGALDYAQILHGGLIDILYLGVKLGIYPSLIFLADSFLSLAQLAPVNPLPLPLLSIKSTARSLHILLLSKIQSSSLTNLNVASSLSVKFITIPLVLLLHFARFCVKIQMWCLSARCAILKPFKPPLPSQKQAT